jgi:hypothetical protein
VSNLYGLTFQLEEPTPNKPTKVINIMVDEEGEKYINYLHQQLQQKENIIKEVREKIESVRIYGLRSGKTLIAALLNDILEILDKENKND